MAHTCGPSPGEAEAGGSAFKVSPWCGRPKEKRKTERRAWLSLRGWGRWMLLSIAKGPEPSSGSLGTLNLAVPPCHHPLPTAATEAAVKGCGREIASLWKLRVEKTQTQDEHTDGTAGLCLGEGLGVGMGPRPRTHLHLLRAGQEQEVRGFRSPGSLGLLCPLVPGPGL